MSFEAGSSENWLLWARTDLRMGRVLAAEDDLPSWGAAFHFQQAAEKALKCMLVFADRKLPKTHDLTELVRLVNEAGLEAFVLGWPDYLNEMNDFAVLNRYPGDVELPGADELALAEATAEILVGYASRAVEG